ncbi:MAG TPA: hypothetical protein VFS05_01445 [Gemmatimonadaceae bacterium]|nr:hypothetical protein [Gemmatimonadaceae bacterium]
MSDALIPPVRRTLRAIACTVVPDAARLDEASWAELEGIIEGAVAARPPAVRRQLGAFLRLVGVIPVLRYGRPFAALDERRRGRVLAWLEDSPLLLARRGFWGVRTLVYMGYYARPAAAAEIGYRAGARGWEGRR